MKASLLFSLLILAAAALFGWKQRDRLASAREVHRQMVAEARALGLSPESLLAEGKAPPPVKRAREDSADRIAAAKSFTRELIAFALEMKEIEKSGNPPDEAFQKRMMELLGRFMELSPAQIKTVIAELRESSGIDDEMRRGIIGFSIMTLAGDQPEAALAIFTESADMKGIADMGGHVVASSLGKWAEKDPLGALEWIRKNAEKHSDLVTDQAKAAILAGAARQDPKLALGLIDELEIKEPHRIASSLTQSARTGEERIALLAALRGEEKHGDLLKSTLNTMGGQLAREGFEASEAWLSSAGLSKAEIAGISEGMSWQTGGDTGRWIEWMADKKIPAETLSRKTDELVSQWTRQDFKAAGEWINGTPEGPVKQAAVKSYANTVAPYEPAAAAQWALTLPTGKERNELLGAIHTEWRKQDEAAAADFAQQHGIGE